MIYDPSTYTYNGMIVPMEFWKPITHEMVPNIKPIYWVSNIGNVYNTETNRFFTRNNLDPNKYIRLGFVSINGGFVYESLHRLVCMAFNGMPENDKMEVDHKNCIKYCNYEDNLEWVTSSENKLRAVYNNRHYIGEDYYKAILTNDDVKQIYEMLSQGMPIKEIASIMEERIKPRIYPGGLKSIIYSILYGECWKSISMDFKFADYNRIYFTESEVNTICNLLEQGLSYDDILKNIDKYDYYDTNHNNKMKNTISNIAHGRIYKNISCNYSINIKKKQTLTNDELDFVCRSIAKNIDPKNVLSNMERGNQKHIRQAVFDIARGVCHKSKVNYYRSQLEGSTTIP